ncbi:VOC family protein [Pimelobacter simplex]|uniref:VOC family protein n=1 Tax=Nocardioides simplex TaxID=2045 RepID=UPI00214F8DF5|nr:VOC family protein [Pimelobacter simplex]UUW87939.1 VOC family protein [Pimelobacter simplex]UUW97444.1 VOC family protein [Pimelobacter simplex]
MSITTTTHLNLPGTARAALAFYQSVFGGQVLATTYGDLGMPAGTPGADRIVFGQLENESGFRLMAYDIPGLDPDRADHADHAGHAGHAGTTTRAHGLTHTDRAFFQSVRGTSLAEVQVCWDGLSDGAEVIEPLAASAWSAGFGMLTDRYGVTWVLDVQPPAENG